MVRIGAVKIKYGGEGRVFCVVQIRGQSRLREGKRRSSERVCRDLFRFSGCLSGAATGSAVRLQTELSVGLGCNLA